MTMNVYRIPSSSSSSSNYILCLQIQSLKSNANISIPKNQHTPTVSYLIKKCGLPLNSAISISRKNDRFKDIVRLIEEMKFDPYSRSFVLAVRAMGGLNWETKIEVYKSFGWSEEDAISAFKLQPQCMLTSEMKIRKMMDFYLNELGLKASDIAKRPDLMYFSLEKRIIPWCSVLQVLLSYGLIENGVNLKVALTMNTKSFEKKYVNKYQEMTPEVCKVYLGELQYPGFETLRAILEKNNKTTHTHSLKSNSNISIPINQHIPTVSYLIIKCGLPLDSAFKASQKIHIETTDKPDSVLQLFKDYDFTQTQITNLITKYPRVILSDPVKTLKPIFEFLESLGLSRPVIAKIVHSYRHFLFRSLSDQIIPAFNFLKRFIHTNRDVATAVARYSYVGKRNFLLELELNIAVLRNHGVPEPNVGKFLMQEPRAATLKNGLFKEIVRMIEEMRIDPSSLTFVRSICVMAAVGKSRLEMKIEAYKSFGWSEEDAISAFKLQPQCMVASEMKIRKMTNFYLNELGLKASDIAKYPNLVMFSLEKWIIPRCSVLQVLLSDGLIESGVNLMMALTINKKPFEKKYVNKYQDMAPKVLEAYQGELQYSGFKTLRAILQCVD